MFCRDCGNENASTNRICAYCESPFYDRRTAAHDRAIANRLAWGVLASAVLLPVIGVAVGLAWVFDDDKAKAAIGRRYLIASLAANAFYALLYINCLRGG